MVRKLLLCASLTGALVLGGAILARSAEGQSQSGRSQAQPPQTEQAPTTPAPTRKQTQQATKSVTGKVASIGTDGHSFSVLVSSGGSSGTVNFVVDANTQVQGQVRQGTPVTVEYLVIEGGQYLAVSVTPQA